MLRTLKNFEFCPRDFRWWEGLCVHTRKTKKILHNWKKFIFNAIALTWHLISLTWYLQPQNSFELKLCLITLLIDLTKLYITLTLFCDRISTILNSAYVTFNTQIQPMKMNRKRVVFLWYLKKLIGEDQISWRYFLRILHLNIFWQLKKSKIWQTPTKIFQSKLKFPKTV